MFRLPVGPWPVTIEQLRQQLADGLQSSLDGPFQLTVSGQWPVLSELTLDLSGARLEPEFAGPVPTPVLERHAGPNCRQLRIQAIPLRLGDIAQPEFELQISELEFEFARDEAGRHWLRPGRMGGGSAVARIAGTGLDRLFLEAARKLSRPQGITVDDAALSLEPAGPNTIRFAAEVGARKLFVKGRVRLVGDAEIGAALDVRLRGLKCEGVGPIGAMAARAIQPHLERLSQRPLQPFGSFPSGLTLEHLELKTGADSSLEICGEISSGPKVPVK